MKKEDLEKLVIGALEGGSNYWYWINDETTSHIIDKQSASTFSEKVVQALLDGEVIRVSNIFGDTETGYITLEVCQQALDILEVYYEDTYKRIRNDQEDAIDYDIWFQVAVFGEVIYG